jgi:PKD repeat protein
VAGTIGAIDNGSGVVGVAPGARLWAVKVLNSQGSGLSSWVIAGIDWVAANAATVEVANMSLGGGGYSQAEYDAIQGAVNAGVAFAVSAGNSDANASNYSPASFNNVMTVSALADFNGDPGGLAGSTCRTDQDDTLADFSNWGPAVDIAAPGVCILSTLPIERGGTGTYSGTSMASPHVTGALAILASSSNPNNSTDVFNLYNQVKSAGNLNYTDDSGDGIKEPLLDVSNNTLFNPVLIPGGGGGGTNQPPTADFTYTTSGLTANFTSTSSDLDGIIVSWNWNFGTKSSSSAQNPSYTYATSGTYSVRLTVSDDDGATASVTKSVTVSSGGGGGITLSVTAYRVSTAKYADLVWNGATSANVDVYRNGSRITTTPNDGAYSDGPLGKGLSATYKVCQAGTSICSNSVTVSW